MSKESESLSKKRARKSKLLAPEVIGDQYSVIPESVYKSKQDEKRPAVRVKTVPLQYASDSIHQRSGDFEKLEHNLVEIAQAKSVEAYVMRSFLKHNNLILKAGWYLDGRNPKTVQYIHNRLRGLSLNTNVPFSLVLRAYVQNIVQYCNAFMVFVRDSERSPGNYRTVFGRTLPPIAGVFSADPTCMYVKRNKHGDPVSWKQRMEESGIEKEFPYYNVVHLYYNREDGFVGGTPWIVPVLDDIRALRRIEELAELLANKHAFPLFHYQVGTESAPARVFDDGSSEVSTLRAEIQNMPTEGCIVTPERHKIAAVDAKGAAVDLEPLLKYWDQRVISGLGLSGVDLGRGDSANRATAQQISKGLSDFCTDLQQVIGEFMDFHFFDQLLEEGGFSTTESNRVHLKFPPIDTDLLMSMEKHAEHMYANHMITRTEARQRIGNQPITPEMDKDMHFEHVDKPLAIIQAVDEPFTSASKKAMAAQSKKANKSENVNRPTNQYGKKPAKTATARDMLLPPLDSLKGEGPNNYIRRILKGLKPMLVQRIEDGMRDLSSAEGKDFFVGPNMRKYFVEYCLEAKLKDVLSGLSGKVTDAPGKVRLASAASVGERILRHVLDNVEVAAYNFGFRYAAMLSGYENVRWKLADSACIECRKSVEDIKVGVRRITFDSLLPRHLQCVEGHEVNPLDRRT